MSPWSRSRTAALVGIAIWLALSGESAPVASANSAEALSPDIAYLVENFGVSVEEATARLIVQDAVPALVMRIMDEHPNDVAGVWIDHRRGGAVVIGIVGGFNPTLAEDIAQDFPFRERLQYETGKSFSYTYLIDSLYEIDSSRNTWHALRGESFGFRLNTQDNHIEIVFDGSSTSSSFYENELTAKYGDAVRYVAEPYTQFNDTCDPFACDPPLRGGIQINNVTRSSLCTLGFVAADKPAPPATAFYALTAGHCTKTADVYRQKISTGVTKIIGPTSQSIDVGWVDAAAILVAPSGGPLKAAGPAYWSPSRWVYHDPFAQSLQIRNKIVQPAAAVPGIFVCRSGYASNAQCGPIIRTFAAPHPVLAFVGLDNSMLLETDLCSANGDSGGPVYTRYNESGIPAGTAFGVHSSSSVNSSCHSAETSYHTHISFAEAQLGVFVWCDQVCGAIK